MTRKTAARDFQARSKPNNTITDIATTNRGLREPYKPVSTTPRITSAASTTRCCMVAAVDAANAMIKGRQKLAMVA